MAKRPPDPFMAMLDLAWDDFKTYDDPNEPSEPMGIVVLLIGNDGESMTLKTGANVHPEYVRMALAQLVMGMATGSTKMESTPTIKRRRVV